MKKIEKQIERDIDDMVCLKLGVNYRGRRPFIYQEADSIEKGSPGRGNIGDWNLETGKTNYDIITIRRDVPEKYKPIIAIHELVAIETLSSQKARDYDTEFAKRWLTKKEFKEYSLWIQNILDKASKKFNLRNPING